LVSEVKRASLVRGSEHGFSTPQTLLAWLEEAPQQKAIPTIPPSENQAKPRATRQQVRFARIATNTATQRRGYNAGVLVTLCVCCSRPAASGRDRGFAATSISLRLPILQVRF